MLLPDKSNTRSPVEPAEGDIFLPAAIIAAFVSTGTAWRDAPSWRLSKERRLWPIDTGQLSESGQSLLGKRVSFVIPAWPEKHAATDHTSTSNRQVSGWVAGQDRNGLIVVDLKGVIWADLGNLKPTLQRK